MAFVPLSDRTKSTLHVDNTSRNASKDRMLLPSYKATMTAPLAALNPMMESTYVHKPYAASVLPESFYSAALVEPMSSLDVSRESACSISVAPTAAKTPIRRVYLNGRPVPVFADAPNTSVDSASSE